MKANHRKASAATAAAAVIVLILDSQTAINGAYDGISICLRTVIPSLFPFFVLSGYLLPYAAKLHMPRLGKLLNIDSGWEAVFILGALGGYPVGTQCICQGYRTGKLDRNHAEGMIGFCTNCGPAFIFGIVGRTLSDQWNTAAVMSIGIISAVLIGSLRKNAKPSKALPPEIPPVSFTLAVRNSVRSMTSVCSWIILGKVLLAFIDIWIFPFMPAWCGTMICGILELSNGCLALPVIENENSRFLLACLFTSFGGLCVAMQVNALCCDAGLSPGTYLSQKSLQGLTSIALAILYLLLPGPKPLRLCTICALSVIPLLLRKNVVEIPTNMLYNTSSKGGM